jgi:FkbM family methyltransferase
MINLQIPAPFFDPLRYAAAKFSRRNPFRKASVELLKRCVGDRPRLPDALTEIRPIDMPSLSFLPSDSMVMETVYWFGVRGYEGVMSDVWRRLCSDAVSVLEIGANVGLFSVIGAGGKPKQYTAVEPLPEVAAILRANLQRNGLAYVQVLEGAVIAEPGERMVQISIPNEGHGAPVGAHLIEKVEIGDRSTLREIAVKGFPMASLINGRDLIKIDAEGIEAELLTAVADAIIRNKPTLVIEVLPGADRLGHLLSQLAQNAGYTIHVVPSYGSDKIVPISAAEFNSATPGRYHSKDVVLSTRPTL